MKAFKYFTLGFLLFLFLYPGALNCAEILQVRTASLLQIGDQNRNYTIQLSCYEVDPSDELSARKWLRKELPRRTKVNFRPEGTMQGILLARVTPVGSSKDLAQELVNAGFGRYICP